MDTTHVSSGPQVPTQISLPKLEAQPAHLIGDISPSKYPDNRLECPRRKIELACDTCRRKKVKCDGGSPACGVCQGRKAECSFRQIMRRKKRPEKKSSLDLMAERIERMECMLRQRGFLKDRSRQIQVTEGDFEEIISEIGRDVESAISEPGANRQGIEATEASCVKIEDSYQQQPEIPKTLVHVEKWLETVPSYSPEPMRLSFFSEAMNCKGG